MAEGFILISMTTARASELTHSNTRIRIRIRITIIMKGADRESVEPPFSCLKTGAIPSLQSYPFSEWQITLHGKLIYSSLT